MVIGTIAATCAITHTLSLPRPDKLIFIAIHGRSALHSPGVFESNPISAAGFTRTLEHRHQALGKAIVWNGEEITPRDFLHRTGTKAFMVLKSGNIVFEDYASGTHADTIFASFSVAKSILSTLVAMAHHRGDLPGAQEDVRQLLPEGMRNNLPTPVRVRDLLNMRAGFGVPESYDSFSQTSKMYLSTNLDRFLESLSTTRGAGRAFEYRSVEYQILGTILRTSTRTSLAEYMSATLWPLIGAQEASWSIDSGSTRVEKAFCCFNARVSDYARFGQWILETAVGNGGDELPENWFHDVREQQGTRGGLGYSHGWWLPPDRSEGDFSAIGIYGQYVYVNPTRGVVIVKFSDYGPEQDEAQTLAAFQQIARHLSTD